jgi:hypothetical protein
LTTSVHELLHLRRFGRFNYIHVVGRAFFNGPSIVAGNQQQPIDALQGLAQRIHVAIIADAQLDSLLVEMLAFGGSSNQRGKVRQRGPPTSRSARATSPAPPRAHSVLYRLHANAIYYPSPDPDFLTYSGAAGCYVEAGLRGAPNTSRAYRADLRRCAAWGAAYGYAPPAAPAAVPALVGFVASLAEAGKKVTTLQRHCAAISKVYAVRGDPPRPPATGSSAFLWMGCRVPGGRQKQASAFRLASFKQVVRGLAPDTAAGATAPFCCRASRERFAAPS